jgi:hypothetical protein
MQRGESQLCCADVELRCVELCCAEGGVGLRHAGCVGHAGCVESGAMNDERDGLRERRESERPL